MRNLQRNAARLGRDDGNLLVQRFGDLDFEALTRRKLQRDLCIGQERVEDLILGTEAQDDDVLAEVRVLLFEGFERLVVDEGGVRVIDRALAGEDELRCVSRVRVPHVGSAEDGVGGEDVRDAFGGAETGDLHDVVALGKGELRHLLLVAFRVNSWM